MSEERMETARPRARTHWDDFTPGRVLIGSPGDGEDPADDS